MSDLNSMYQNGAGSMASYFGGQNQAMHQKQEEATLQSLMMKNEQQAIMNPLDAQFRQSQIDEQAAQLPGVVGQSQTLAAKGTEDTHMLSARLATKLYEQTAQKGEAGMKVLQQDGDRFSSAASMLSKLPPASQKAGFLKFMEQYGGDANNPMIKGLLQAPDEEFLKTLQVISSGMALAGHKYQQDRDLRDRENASQERINAANNDRARDVADTSAAARMKAAELKQRVADASLSLEKRIAALIAKPDRTPEETEQLNNMQEYALTLKAVAANAVTPNVLGQDAPVTVAAKAADRLTPTTPKAAPAPTDNFEAIAKQQGMSYEPSKYQYRVIDGKLQRKAK